MLSNDLATLEGILILLSVSLFMALIMKKINIPSTIGFIAAGVILGPHVIGVVHDKTNIHALAHFGLVFLMFVIGLNFSWNSLIQQKKNVFLFGGLQVLTTVVLVSLGAYILNIGFAQSIILGCIVAMSSTALVLKQLLDQNELNYEHGRNAFGILLLQDLAVIPFLILIPSLSQISPMAFSVQFLYAIAKSFFAIVLIFVTGHYLIKRMYSLLVDKTDLELITLFSVFVALGASWLTAKFGLSLTLGAFFSGMLLGETALRSQVISDVRPIRDVLMGLFFIAIGMQLNFELLKSIWPQVTLLLATILVIKAIIIAIVGLMLGYTLKISLKTGLVLANCGEFGLAILMLSNVYDLLSRNQSQIILTAILLSMILSSIIIKTNDKLIK